MLTKCMYAAALNLLLVISLEAQISDKVGTTGFQFLKIGVGSREAAIGGAGPALASGPTAIYWNVAGISVDEYTAVTFFHTWWIADMSHNYFALKFPVAYNHYIGFAVDHLAVGTMEETTIEEPQGTGRNFTSGDIAITGSYATRISDRFSAGLSAKYLREYIWDLVTEGWAFDFGFQYVFEGIHIGMAFKDFGTEKQIGGAQLETDRNLFEGWDTSPLTLIRAPKGIRLPTSFHLGAGYEILSGNDHELLATGSMSYFNDIGQTQSLGAEYTLLNTFTLRGGYQFGRALYSASGGLGLKVQLGGTQLVFGFALVALKDFGARSEFDIGLSF